MAQPASAFTLVDTLKKAGKNLTRAGVMAAARSLNEANNPFVLPGIVIKTGSFNLISGSAGFKAQVGPNLLLTVNLLFQMNNEGLRAKVVPLAGLSYTF